MRARAILALVVLAAVACTEPEDSGCLPGAEVSGPAPWFGRSRWCELADGELHGRQMLWYRYGHVLAEANFRDGELDGRVLYQDRRGWPLREVHFRAGELDGRVRAWEPGLHKVLEGHYAASERDGVWTTWDPDGTKRSERHYRAGLAHGPAREWRADGSLALEGEFVGGRPVGRWVWRDPKGRTTKAMTFASTATVERYAGEKLVGSTTLTDPERILAEQQAP